MARQRDDVRPTVTVAARTLHLLECNPDRGFRIARLHAQIHIDNRSATIASDDCAAEILARHEYPLAESRALKRRTVASASRCASHSRRVRVTVADFVVS